MPLLRTLALLALVSATGCDGADSDSARSQPDADLQLELGETGTSDGLAIVFEAVTDDSRCPDNHMCVWEGQATVALRIEGTADTLLVSGSAVRDLGPPAYVDRDGVRIRAVGLTPYPGSPAAERGDTPVVGLATERISD